MQNNDSKIDKEFIATTIPSLLFAFIPNVWINPWVVIVIYIIAIFSYLYYSCHVQELSVNRAKRYFILNSIPAIFFCIFIVIMKLWVLADI